MNFFLTTFSSMCQLVDLVESGHLVVLEDVLMWRLLQTQSPLQTFY
jgi:hypothetical protein